MKFDAMDPSGLMSFLDGFKVDSPGKTRFFEAGVYSLIGMVKAKKIDCELVYEFMMSSVSSCKLNAKIIIRIINRKIDDEGFESLNTYDLIVFLTFIEPKTSNEVRFQDKGIHIVLDKMKENEITEDEVHEFLGELRENGNLRPGVLNRFNDIVSNRFLAFTL